MKLATKKKKSASRKKKATAPKRHPNRVWMPFLMMMIGAMALLSLFTGSAGILGERLRIIFEGLFHGNAAYVAFLLLMTATLQFLDIKRAGMAFLVPVVFVVVGAILYGIVNELPRTVELMALDDQFNAGAAGKGPGVVNALVYAVSVKYLGVYGSLFMCFVLVLATASIVFERSATSLVRLIVSKGHRFLGLLGKTLVGFFTREVESTDKGGHKRALRKKEKEIGEEPPGPAGIAMGEPVTSKASAITVIDYAKEYEGKEKAERKPGAALEPVGTKSVTPPEPEALEINKELTEAGREATYERYSLPSPKLLEPKPENVKDLDRKAVLRKAKDLERTLNDFGVDAKVIQISRGPTITRYELQPKPGVKVSRIVSLSDDIALNLAAKNIRIEAPIPGKAAVGIEVPNEGNTVVSMRELIESRDFKSDGNGLTFALGKDISGKPILSDLSEMPHLLIAGATGSGKSVCVNALITSLLFCKRPDEVKFLMIDPKVVELNQYNGIPHLIMPVVTDPQKSAAALNWVVKEMNDRYKTFAESNVRDIKSYNRQHPEREMYQIVVIIDELSDLMMAAPAQVEDAICRIAQMARAAGIHLIVATQRPSVDVITGIIKANIPSRIAFAVSSQADSRTILDMGGAEKLLGKGDMLYYPVGQSKPKRVQGVFVSDQETRRVLEHIKSQVDEVAYEEIPTESFGPVQGGEPDELLTEVIETVAGLEQVSISMLQRKFRMGYNRAARLIDELESRGIVSPSEGKKPRNVLINEGDVERPND